MTGEITLAGDVLPVGGIRDKVLATHRCGLTRVLLPERNRQDVDEKLGADGPHALDVRYVATMNGLLDLARDPRRVGHGARVGGAAGHRAGDRDAEPCQPTADARLVPSWPAAGEHGVAAERGRTQTNLPTPCLDSCAVPGASSARHLPRCTPRSERRGTTSRSGTPTGRSHWMCEAANEDRVGDADGDRGRWHVTWRSPLDGDSVDDRTAPFGAALGRALLTMLIVYGREPADKENETR